MNENEKGHERAKRFFNYHVTSVEDLIKSSKVFFKKNNLDYLMESLRSVVLPKKLQGRTNMNININMTFKIIEDVKTNPLVELFQSWLDKIETKTFAPPINSMG